MSNVLDGRAGRKVLEDLAAERAVLGAVLADNTLIAERGGGGPPGRLLQPAAHARSSRRCSSWTARQRQVDHLTLAEELKVPGQLAAVGGPAYLMTLDQVRPLSPTTRSQYAEIVRDQALRRRLANVGREIHGAGQPGHRRRRGGARRVRAQALPPGGEAARGRSPAGQRADGADARSARQDEGLVARASPACPPAIVDLDKQLTGLHAGRAHHPRGAPRHRQDVAGDEHRDARGAEGGPRRSAIFSPGNARGPAADASAGLQRARGHEEAARRPAHASTTRRSSRRWRASSTTRRIYIDDSGGLSPFDLRAKARRLKQKDPRLALIVIDYLQLMHQKGKVESRQLEVSEICRVAQAAGQGAGGADHRAQPAQP